MAAAVAATRAAEPGLGVAFLVAGVALFGGSIAIASGHEEDIAVQVLQALAAGTFGLKLADLAVSSPFAQDRYHALWLPSVLGTIAVAARLSRRPLSPNQAMSRGRR